MVGESDIMVSIQHLSKSFGETEVLRDVNVDVKRGEVVVVLGPSGSGKSTMLRCINLLEKPTGGHIFIEGQEITAPGTDVDKLREHVGMVFQQFNLFPHLSAKKNVMLAQRKVLSSTASGLPIAPTSFRQHFPVASSSVSRLHVLSPWIRMSCCSTRPPQRSTPSSCAAFLMLCAAWLKPA